MLLKTLTTKEDLTTYLNSVKGNNLKIGLVPTMGALHEGHLSLIAASKKTCDLTVATIFVNPTQFNNANDLLKYPKPIERDKQLLKDAGCDVLFNPEVEEIYGNNEQWDYKVGELNTVLEGKFRPGHYEGVTQIVYKLFALIKPTFAFFGQKDYQQFMVINEMTENFKLPVKLKACGIVREKDGLAMSSRNARLNSLEREQALQLYRSLSFIKANYGKLANEELLKQAKAFYTHNLLDLEYLEIVDRDTLLAPKEQSNAIVLVACSVGNTRLIDNMMLP